MSIEYPYQTLPIAPKIPAPTRPQIEGYGIPEDQKGILDWSFVRKRMAKSRNYWIATTGENGRPHAVPVWGIWYNEILYFGGGPNTRWSRNLAHRPEVVVHLESGDEAVILEGFVQRMSDVALMAPIDDCYLVKYDMRHGPPVWVLTPRVVFAWGTYPTTATRWQF
jgi:hypothetical protein